MDSELVQVNLALPELRRATAEAEILAALQGQPGVHSIQVVETSLHILYDPLLTTEHILEAAVRKSGHEPQGALIERDSLFEPADAISPRPQEQ